MSNPLKTLVGAKTPAEKAPFTPTSQIEHSNVQDAIAYVRSLLSGYQPLDSDLTAIAALSTTSYGRALLTLADAAALAALVDSYFLTPSEGDAAYQPLDAVLTDLAGITFTQGDVLYYDGSNLVRLGPGTNGQVLQTQGVGANPIWSSAGAGDMAAAVYDAANITEQLVGLTATQTLTNKTLTSPTINSPALGSDSVDAISEISSSLRSGSDTTLVTGTPGTNGNFASWDANGDAVDSGSAPSDFEPADADILKADVADSLTAGMTSTPLNEGTKSSGTYTPAFASRNLLYAINGGAHTLAAPSTGYGTLTLTYRNNGSAGNITLSGFDDVSGDDVSGSTFSGTVNGDSYDFIIRRTTDGTDDFVTCYVEGPK